MAYSKQTWDTTSIFNPTRMNHIEDGIESASTADGTEYSSGVSVKDMLDYSLEATTHGTLVRIGHLRFFLVDLGLITLQNNMTYSWSSEIPVGDSPSTTTLFGQALDSNSNVKLNISGGINSNGSLVFRTSNGVDGQYYLRMWSFWVV